MTALARSVRRFAPTSFALLALAVVACATAEEPEDDDDDDNGPTQTGGITGTGGNSSTAGNKPNGTGGTPTNTTGGTPTNTTGGTPTSTGGVATGGTPTTTGGTTGTAGATTGTCPPYTGTLAADSTIFMAGFGKSTAGTTPWSGYGYTYKYGTATISPGMGNSCFAGAKFCANGSVPADDKSGAGLGWNIGQAMGAATTTKVAITGSIKLTFKGIAAGMRVQLSADATTSYCYTLLDTEATAGTATIPAASFKTECWGTTGTAYAGTPIEAIQIAVPGSTAGTAKTFDFCVLDVEPG